MQNLLENWQEARDASKSAHLMANDALKELTDYAKRQGSRNSDKFYLIYTNMVNQALFDKEFLVKNKGKIRENLDAFSLDILQTADTLLAYTVTEFMEQGVPYKEIFQQAKKRVHRLASSFRRSSL
jgi:hypothetical protein